MQKKYLAVAISLGLALLVPSASAHDGAADSFTVAVEQAWQISRKQALADKRLAAIDNSRQANQGWFANTPELSGQYSGDQFAADNGKVEYEIEVEVPLWLPGQQAANKSVLDARYSVQELSIQVDKLALAGIVRTLYWDIARKINDLQLAQRRLDAAEKIATDVRRQINSGILADTDALLARTEVLNSRGDRLAAQQELNAAEQMYLARTGLQLTGHWAMEALALPRAIETHPLLQKSLSETQAAHFNFQRIRIEDRDNARLSIGWSNERDSRDEEYSDRIQIGFNLPLGKDRGNGTELIEAEAEQLETEIHLSELKRDLEAGIAIASAALKAARLHQENARLKRDTSARRADLDQATFDAGELGLQQLLTSRSSADEAEQSWQQQRIETARAISELNQALGYLPQQQLGEESK